MAPFLKKLTKSIRASLLLDKAWNELAKNNPQMAEKYFDDILKIISYLCAEHQIMLAYIKYKNSKYSEAKELFDDAWKKCELEDDLNENEKEYFKGFILGPAEITMKFLKNASQSVGEYKYIRHFDISKIDLRKVDKKWKRHFPMRDHPNWVEYGA